MKNIVLFGASGNIGQQTLEILKEHQDKFNLQAISIGKNVSKLNDILINFKSIKVVYSTNRLIDFENKYQHIKFITSDIELLILDECDIVVNALSGFFGLKITLNSIEKEKILLNANKESFVVAGELINNLLSKKRQAKVYPLDSEHCAIFQCLEKNNCVSKIYLTASGGPFRNLTLDDTKKVTLQDALNHPNWNMGSKITIDSATMLNKAFEILEAFYLFANKNIEVLIHPASLIHSMVEFNDGSIKAQISVPDMKQVINYFLFYPNRMPFKNQKNLDFSTLINLELQKIDSNRFIPIKMAYECIEGFNSKAIGLNAANEVCVEAFLNKKISFYQITQIVNKIFNSLEKINYNNYNEIVSYDLKIRKLTIDLIEGEK
ncbi:1-deoxy-D-xylulose 5-phosphate reductoisomerase [Spiroplasma gladiatoris]|uniref:1-deoxy-D-xylulose 5-phosphate reductoisomerase n=1 Tax=Spiroplasma gladiatoris TaxID=2143 RepID=A0A4V1AQB4_9MOLU|nr:1-deoxy-D-xylulose-5-phosphate reductoisomerase [Spiroplasma gladiatoris]QBQ07909.1 1-deoxy-D-xylulose 5-phosphate reductoisomerase [Spiroplasma gladiatoris]